MLYLWLFLQQKEKIIAGFISGNSNEAIVHLHCKNIRIKAEEIFVYNPMTRAYLEKVIVFKSGRYTITGIYQTTDNKLNKTINLKSVNVELEIYFEGGCTYSASMYMHSPEEGKSTITFIQMRLL